MMNLITLIKKGLFAAILAAFFSFSLSAAYGVMPPEHYVNQIKSSKIKAIAAVTEVRIVSRTKYHTRKQVFFDRIKGFDTGVPVRFSGFCYSVDSPNQIPMPGGTLYYHPVVRQKVLVTISDDSGSITSFTRLDSVLKNELEKNGLKNIEYRMGKALVNADTGTWFSFFLDGKPMGYLNLQEHRDINTHGTGELEQFFVFGESEANKRLFHIRTRFRDDGDFSVEWISIQPTIYSGGISKVQLLREYGFRPSETPGTKPGILVKDYGSYYDIPVPGRTTTDFLLFLLVKNLPFKQGFPVQIHIVETLELHFKKNILLEYSGRDESKNGLHRFHQTGAAKAVYWLNDNHDVIEVAWDSGQWFVISNKADAEKKFPSAEK